MHGGPALATSSRHNPLSPKWQWGVPGRMSPASDSESGLEIATGFPGLPEGGYRGLATWFLRGLPLPHTPHPTPHTPPFSSSSQPRPARLPELRMPSPPRVFSYKVLHGSETSCPRLWEQVCQSDFQDLSVPVALAAWRASGETMEVFFVSSFPLAFHFFFLEGYNTST